MKSAKFLVGLTVLAVLCCASFAFGASADHAQSTYVGASATLPATLMMLTFAPGANLQHAKPQNNGWGGGGGNGGGSGCGQGGNGGGGWGGNGGWGGGGGNGGGGWGGGGGNGGSGGCGVPEGGNSLEYLLIGAMACIGAMAYRSRRQNAVSEI
jgi:hypothetical protein